MLSPFQEQKLREIERSPVFKHWCLDPHPLRDNNHRGPKLFTYYTTDGRLHTIKVGQTGVLLEISS